MTSHCNDRARAQRELARAARNRPHPESVGMSPLFSRTCARSWRSRLPAMSSGRLGLVGCDAASPTAAAMATAGPKQRAKRRRVDELWWQGALVKSRRGSWKNSAGPAMDSEAPDVRS